MQLGLFKSVTKALVWLIFVMFIGSAQVGMTYLFRTISDVQGIDFPRLIIDGFFVFFSISMVSTVMVRTIYHIPDLQQFFTDNGDEIRPEIMDQLLVLAIAHARGVQSTIISGTPISKTLIQG